MSSSQTDFEKLERKLKYNRANAKYILNYLQNWNEAAELLGLKPMPEKVMDLLKGIAK